MKVTENGSFNIFNKSQEFRFTPEGLFRRKGRGRGASKGDEEQLSYKVGALGSLVHLADAIAGL